MVQKFYKLGKQVVDGKKFVEYVKKYNHSPKGIAKRKKYVQKNRINIQRYNINYQRLRRLRAKKLGLCSTCYSRPSIHGYKSCLECRTRIFISNQKSSSLNGVKDIVEVKQKL